MPRTRSARIAHQPVSQNVPLPPHTPEPLIKKVTDEVNAAGNFDSSDTRCRQIIGEIERITGHRTITYFGSQTGFVEDEDSVNIEDLLRIPSSLPGLDLILNSSGGYAISAERIINVCRNYTRNNSGEFRVIVPRLAKSAATIVALGADKILLCDNAELGPIDPQLLLQDKDGRKVSRPMFLIYRAIKELMEGASFELETKNQKYLQFLQGYSYDIYVSAENELNLSQDIAKKIAERKREKYPNFTYESLEKFTDPSKTYSHGRLIGIEDLETTPLYTQGFIQDMTKYFSNSGSNHLTPTQVKSLGNLIWELFIRWSSHFTNAGNPVNKIIEDNNHKFVYFDPDWKPIQLNPQIPLPLQPPVLPPANPAPTPQQPNPSPQSPSP